ncbi:hypothetical protein [uncultured Alteromonas sp.]|jgi:hypothetical protein|uniref:hypothetical protein n=1 Tax=uncultured Alteromonas sp. TaxID=179113 RepID=UPI0025DE96C3|nr:hypothetical protein [uncultured Alteromonas sp.]
MKILSAIILPALLLAVSVNTYADNVLQAIATCKAIANNTQRLACFDAIESSALERLAAQQDGPLKPSKPVDGGKPQRSAEKAPDRPQQVQASRGESQRDQARRQSTEMPDDFGLPPKTFEEDIDEITAVITRLGETARGKMIITLDNGSQWQQKDSQPLRLTVGMEVTIESGFLGAFFLSHDGVNRRIKVKRTR